MAVIDLLLLCKQMMHHRHQEDLCIIVVFFVGWMDSLKVLQIITYYINEASMHATPENASRKRKSNSNEVYILTGFHLGKNSGGQELINIHDVSSL